MRRLAFAFVLLVGCAPARYTFDEPVANQYRYARPDRAPTRVQSNEPHPAAQFLEGIARMLLH